jgi:hypothetical protein
MLKVGGQYSVKDFERCIINLANIYDIMTKYGELNIPARVVVMQEDYIEKALHCSQRI